MTHGKSVSLSTTTLSLGGVAVLAFPLVRTTPFGDAWYFAIVLLAIMAATVGLHCALPARRVPWLLLIGFMVAQFAGGVIQALTDDMGDFGAGVTAADVAFIVSYVCALTALALQVSRVRGAARTVGVVDAAILLVGLLLIGGEFLLLSSLRGQDLAGVLDPIKLRVWYPVGSYALLSLLIWVSTANRQGPAAYFLLRAGFTTWAIAESAFHLTVSSIAVPDWWVQALWLLSYILIGAGVAHPDKGEPETDTPSGADSLPSRAGFLALALCGIPVSMWSLTYFDPLDARVLVLIAGTLLASLIWLRFNLLYRYLCRLGSDLRRKSETDPVSGAWNRHYFDQAIARALHASPPQPLAVCLLRIEGIDASLPRSTQEKRLFAAANALARAGQEGDPVARVGEREFALILHRPGPDERLLASAWRALNELRDAWQGETGADSPRAHVGIASAPRDAASPEGLLDCVSRRVDAAARLGIRVVTDETPAMA